MGEGRAFIYTDPGRRRGRGGHSYIQTLGGGGGGDGTHIQTLGEGRALPYTDPRGEGGGESTPIYRPLG